jgi:hypothetical protein
MEEIWKLASETQGQYEVSNLGRVRRPGKAIIATNNKSGYRSIRYRLPNRRFKVLSVHRMVAVEFVPNPEQKPHVHHIDFNPSNNVFTNLMWVTAVENNAFSREAGRWSKPPKHYYHPRFKMTYEKATELRRLAEEHSLTRVALAAKFGISKPAVNAILAGRYFKPGIHPDSIGGQNA